MATNFGFLPVQTGKRYFISYKTEDSLRVGKIVYELHKMGIPMWYDYGIEKGERWSRAINENLRECEAVLLFATKRLFASEDPYVRKEYKIAIGYHKKIFVVWLDNISFDDVHNNLKDWFVDIEELQGVKIGKQSEFTIASYLANEFKLERNNDLHYSISTVSSQPVSDTKEQADYHFQTPLAGNQSPKKAARYIIISIVIVLTVFVLSFVIKQIVNIPNSNSHNDEQDNLSTPDVSSESFSSESINGHIYFLNDEPIFDTAYQEFSTDFTKKTGIQADTLTAAESCYESVLSSEMAKSDCPTIFKLKKSELPEWIDYCYDLSDSDVYKNLSSDYSVLTDSNKIYGIRYNGENGWYQRYWCINANEPEEDIQAALIFLNAMVTSGELRTSLSSN